MKDILNDANRMIQDFNNQDLPYQLELVQDEHTNINEGIFVVAKWKWMDATYFSGISITNEIKDFAVYVKLEPKGDYIWFDSKEEYNLSVNPNNISSEASSFYGKTWSYHKEIVLGKDNQLNKTGLVSFTLNTKSIHQPIEEWLYKNGYKKRKITLKEHANNYAKSQDSTINKIIGCMFTIGGSIFTVIGLVSLIKSFLGDTAGWTSGNGTPATAGDLMIMGLIFSFIGITLLIIGIILLNLFKIKKQKN